MDNNTLDRYFTTVLSSHRIMLYTINTLKQQEETIRQLARLPAIVNSNEQSFLQTSRTSPNMYFPARPSENITSGYVNRPNALSELFAEHIVNALNNLPDTTPVVVRPTELQIEQATENMLFSQLPPIVERVYNCPVSHDTFQDNSEITRICHCGHYFGRDAIMTWFSMNVHCPICRYDIRNSRATREERSPGGEPAIPATREERSPGGEPAIPATTRSNTALYYELDFSF